MEVQIILKQTLLDLGISPYQLAIESKIRPNTIYDIIDNRKKSINLNHLTVILNTLNQICQENSITTFIDIDDILIYKKKSASF